MESQTSNPSTSSSVYDDSNSVISAGLDGLHQKHQQELENLTLATQPTKTLKFFILAVIQYLRRPLSVAKDRWFILLTTLAVGIAVFVAAINGPHREHVLELIRYLRFALWWFALGVASSIGLGSGLHTFVLYLGPHIALFTLKAVHCGRVDLKSAPYDTIQWNTGASWLEKDCTEYEPFSPSGNGSSISFSSILQQVQLEAILWGIGTAIGELPPYFISRAASASGKKMEVMEELSPADSTFASHLKQIKQWLLSHSQFLNFFTILVLASVPNPLFDLAGILCGQFGIPFWKFFFATLIGKAFIKTHIQTILIISVCNNQLLGFIENQLIWVLSFIPGLGSILPKLLNRIHTLKDGYMAPLPVPPDVKVRKWNFTFGSIWNTVVSLILLNFLIKIITGTAQNFLKDLQEKELETVTPLSETESLTVGSSRSID
ncbi:meiotic spindle pole body protein Kms1 [Ancistrocladus abbreviatus]